VKRGAARPRVVYQRLDGLVTTKPRPGGGLICEVRVPSRTKPDKALPCIVFMEALLHDMAKVLLRGLSLEEQHKARLAALREVVAAMSGPA
jgi:hypothetical protein